MREFLTCAVTVIACATTVGLIAATVCKLIEFAAELAVCVSMAAM